MAKVTIENSTESDLCITGFDGQGNLVQVLVPSAREAGEDQIVNGQIEAEDTFVSAVAKKSAVIQHYFDEGWLAYAKPTAEKKSSKRG